jgi:hypothetical protein
MTINKELENRCINTIRILSADAVQYANAGHPGMPMGAAAMAYTLWTGFLKHNPRNPQWFDRDRFVLSAGHGSMLLYSLLHLTGYDLPLEEIKRFRKWGSKTAGHPERGLAPGVEVTTGPLGQGVGNGVGLATVQSNEGRTKEREISSCVWGQSYSLCGALPTKVSDRWTSCFEGNEIRGLEQNPETKSRCAQMARSGKKVMQFLREGRYVANVVRMNAARSSESTSAE